MKTIIKLDLEATPKDISNLIKGIKFEYAQIKCLPEKKRRTKKIMNRLIKIKMLEGYLEGIKRI